MAETAMTIIFILLTICAIIVGILGTFVPVLPGIPLAFLAILLYGWYDGFEHISPTYLIVLGIFTIISIVVDQLSMILGMKVFKSDNRAIIGSAIGSIVGIFIWPPFGILIFCFLGAFIVEYYLYKDSTRAFRSSIGALVGFISGTLFKVILGVGFLISFIIALF